MENNSQAVSDATQEPSGVQEIQEASVQTESKKDSVAYETYRKVLGEKKKRDEQIAEMQSRLEAIEQEKMAEQGKFQELADTWKSKAIEHENNLKQLQSNYALKSVTDQIEREAMKAGCTNTEKLMRLVNIEDLTDSVGEGFKVDSTALKEFVEKAKVDNDFLFSVKGPGIKDGVPAKVETEKKGLESMSLDDKLRLLAKKINQ